MTEPAFAEAFDPDHGLVDPIDEDEARRRDRRKQPYVVSWPDRCLAVDRGDGTMNLHSLGEAGQRGYLAYRLARKTREWRLTHLYIEGSEGPGMFVEVPLWEGRAKVASAPFEAPAELDPPPEALRSFAPPAFGEWESVLALPVDPTAWIDVPDGFHPLDARKPADGP